MNAQSYAYKTVGPSVGKSVGVSVCYASTKIMLYFFSFFHMALLFCSFSFILSTISNARFHTFQQNRHGLTDRRTNEWTKSLSQLRVRNLKRENEKFETVERMKEKEQNNRAM